MLLSFCRCAVVPLVLRDHDTLPSTSSTIMPLADLFSSRCKILLVLVDHIAELIVQLLCEHPVVLISCVRRQGVFHDLADRGWLSSVMPSSVCVLVLLRVEDVAELSSSCLADFLLLQPLWNDNDCFVVFLRWLCMAWAFLHPFRLQCSRLVLALSRLYIGLVLWIGEVLPFDVGFDILIDP